MLKPFSAAAAAAGSVFDVDVRFVEQGGDGCAPALHAFRRGIDGGIADQEESGEIGIGGSWEVQRTDRWLRLGWVE